ncbi:MFS transporter [Streptomyces sp. CNQ085]|uniref:MFS transporter n=1 Tax=Streptomyces sp. CNQ085 TaxID=2886944 RepID=UPI001F514D7D|nr:MFS transporter [Streptomyces sp. CNQ085]MCI0386087.1 MFS transporter [Streptomyces sp. CNQ085]
MVNRVEGPGVTARAPVQWGGRRWALLFVLSGNMVLDAIEVSVVLMALPTISEVLGLSPWGSQWLMSGFALGFAAMLLLGPRITRSGHRRPVYLGAMLLFAMASAAGGLTDNVALLVAIRVVKGFCAALTAPAGLAIINDTFPEGPQRRRAVSVYSLFGAAGFTIGLLLSGLLVESSWRWTFLFPAPVALVLLLCGLYVLPGDPVDRSFQRPPRFGLLRDRSLLRSSLGAASLNGTYQSILVLMTFQAQRQLGWSPWQTALALLPACVPLAVTVPFADRLVASFGTTRLITLGAFLPFLGYVFYLCDSEGPYATGMLPTLLLVESGFVCAFAALNMQSTASVETADRGGAVSLYQACVQLGAGTLLPLVALQLTLSESHRPALLLIAAAGALGLAAALTGHLERTGHART